MDGPDNVIELFHGYTYSGHPLAAAACLATLDIYRDEGLFERAKTLEPIWADAVMALKGEPNVLDIRTLGLVGGIDLALAARRRRQARLRGDGPRLPRGGPDDPHHRRHDRPDAAADRHGRPDRRDRREDARVIGEVARSKGAPGAASTSPGLRGLLAMTAVRCERAGQRGDQRRCMPSSHKGRATWQPQERSPAS